MALFPQRRMAPFGIAAAGTVLALACGPTSSRFPGASPSDVPVRLRVQVEGHLSAVSLEQYVLGAALSEVTPTGESDAAVKTIFEVQAIVARTYAVSHLGRHANDGFDLCDKTHCQIYQPGRIQTSKFAAIARRAVVATTGRILRYGGRPAEALFHSDCGGRTTTPADAWGGSPRPYLPDRRDDVPDGTHRSWQFAATVQELTNMLRRDPRTDPGGTLENLDVTRTDSSGRAAEVAITGRQTRRVSGSVLRAVIGERSVMSTRFAVSHTATGFRLNGSGFGHGVGLCQVGAIARARRGDTVSAILGHYYPGAQ